MLVHQKVYEAIYDEWSFYYATYSLEASEGLASNGRKFSLRSKNIWNVIRKVNGEKFYVALKALGLGNIEYWVYYRLLTNYSCKPGSVPRMFGKYQEIHSEMITAPLKKMGYELENPSDILLKDLADCGEPISTLCQAEAELLLEQFIKQRRPKLSTLLKWKCVKVTQQTKNKRPYRNIKNPMSLQKGFADISLDEAVDLQKLNFYDAGFNSIENFMRTYLDQLTKTDFLNAFKAWCPAQQELKWHNQLLLFFLDHSNLMSIDSFNIFDLSITHRSAKCIISDFKLFYQANEFVMGFDAFPAYMMGSVSMGGFYQRITRRRALNNPSTQIGTEYILSQKRKFKSIVSSGNLWRWPPDIIGHRSTSPDITEIKQVNRLEQVKVQLFEGKWEILDISKVSYEVMM